MSERREETVIDPTTGEVFVEYCPPFEEIPSGPVVRRHWTPPRRYVVWSGLASMLVIALAVGLGNWLVFEGGINERNREASENTDAIGMYVQALMLIWSIVSGWLLYRVDDASTKVAQAVADDDLGAFLHEATRRIALTVRLLHLLLSVLFIHSFHLYHIDGRFTSLEVQAGIGFLVTLTVLFIWDLDDPLHGVINVANIPSEWRKAVHP
jgi:hypothetical protein